MTEHPILFSGPMVRAILAGTKTQTRRLVVPAPLRPEVSPHCENGWWMWRVWTPEHAKHGFPSVRTGDRRCPYGEPGDRLWLKERHAFLEVRQRCAPQQGFRWDLAVEYSDGTEQDLGVNGAKPKQTRDRGEHKWRPSIHMPRWASRITLEVTGVRVERLQEISNADAQAEGIDEENYPPPPADQDYVFNYRVAYEQLWDSINAKRAPWASNPYVWVVAFRRTP